MKLHKEELKSLYRERASRLASKDDCLTPDTLRRLIAKELPANERRSAIAHLRICANCTQEYRIAHSTRQWAAQVAPSPNETTEKAAAKASRWNQFLEPFRWRAAAIAALFVFAVATSLVVWQTRQPSGETVSGERGGSGLKLQIEPTDKALLDEAPKQLAWSPIESAETYQVTLYDFELTPLWESQPLTQTQMQIPDSIRASLKRGQAIYWRVVVQAGIEHRQSDIFQFRLKADQ